MAARAPKLAVVSAPAPSKHRTDMWTPYKLAAGPERDAAIAEWKARWRRCHLDGDRGPRVSWSD